MWDLSSSTRDQTLITCIERRILNHWSTKEVPKLVIDLTWIITMPALGPGLSLTSRYLLQGLSLGGAGASNMETVVPENLPFKDLIAPNLTSTQHQHTRLVTSFHHLLK